MHTFSASLFFIILFETMMGLAICFEHVETYEFWQLAPTMVVCISWTQRTIQCCGIIEE